LIADSTSGGCLQAYENVGLIFNGLNYAGIITSTTINPNIGETVFFCSNEKKK